MKTEYWLKGLAHVGLYVDDPQAVIDWYVENLDFHFISREVNNGVECWFAGCGGLVIEFIKRPYEKGTGPWAHVCIEVIGIDKKVEELKAKGIIPEDAEIGGNTDFMPSGIRNIFFDGPTGEKLELLEYARPC